MVKCVWPTHVWDAGVHGDSFHETSVRCFVSGKHTTSDVPSVLRIHLPSVISSSTLSDLVGAGVMPCTGPSKFPRGLINGAFT
jgi:hypothetical protein